MVGQIAQIFIGSALAKYFALLVKREQRAAVAASSAALADPVDAAAAAEAGDAALAGKDSCKTLPSLSESSNEASPIAADAAASQADGRVKAKDVEAGAGGLPVAAGAGEQQ